MADYNPKRGGSYNYGGKQWKLSRSKIDLFLECPRCFYIDNKLGTKRPTIPTFQINKAVDYQLKQEFDVHRAENTQHSLQKEYGIDAKPAPHEKIDEWRDALRGGITFQIDGTNVIVTGGIDDVWKNPKGELHVVDYKATSKEEEVTLDADWQIGYKRQMEVYQWIFRQMGFKVNETGYFVYANAGKNRDKFDARLEFELQIISHKGDTSWVEPTIFTMKKCLDSDSIPESDPDCELCMYRKLIRVKE